MPDPQKRIIVDGVDFGGLVLFPRILGAVTASLQPPRLVIGLLMVTALVTAGRLWDRYTTPTVAPTGLTASWTADEQAAARQRLQQIVFDSGWVPESVRADLDRASPPPFDAREVRQWVADDYRERRAAGPDRPPEQVADEDDQYLRMLAQIDAARPRGTFEAAADQFVMHFTGIVRSVIGLRADQVIEHLESLFIRVPVVLWNGHKVFTISFGLLILLIATLGGGALARMSACQVAGHRRLRLDEAVDFAFAAKVRLVGAPLVPLLYIVVGSAVIVALGLLMTVPWLDVLGGVLYGSALITGLLVALLAVGYVGALSLLVPAVACDNCDAGDAAQRGYAYVAAKPLHRLGYAIVSLAGLALGFLLVSLVAGLAMNLTARLFGTFTSSSAIASAGGFELFDLSRDRPGAIHPDTHTSVAAWFVGLWETLIVSLVAAYAVVYYFSASTRVYLLLRRACDGQDIEEIWEPGLVPGTLAPMPEATLGSPVPEEGARDSEED